jgi:hypothetical protein
MSRSVVYAMPVSIEATLAGTSRALGNVVRGAIREIEPRGGPEPGHEQQSDSSGSALPVPR